MILLTGNLGFIGHWLQVYLLKKGFDDLVCIDNRSSRGKRLSSFASHNPEITQLYVDLGDFHALDRIIDTYQPTTIFHVAGQAIVPRSFQNPYVTFNSNVSTTFNLLELSRRYSCIKKLLVVTSDKVYKNDNSGRHFCESDILGGKDVYSSSKVICEELVSSYRLSHNDNNTIYETARLGNVVGGGDFSVGRLIPDLVKAFTSNDKFFVRYPKATRPFQHVLDVVDGLSNILLHNPLTKDPNYLGSEWNLGPKDNSFMYVEEVIAAFCDIFGSLDIEPTKFLYPEDLMLAVDNTKYASTFGAPAFDSISSVLKAISWYKESPVPSSQGYISFVEEVSSFISSKV